MINAERVTVQQVYRGTSTIGIINSFNKGKYKTKIYRPQEVSCFYARESNTLLVLTCRLNEPLGEVDGYNNLFLRVVLLDLGIEYSLVLSESTSTSKCISYDDIVIGVSTVYTTHQLK